MTSKPDFSALSRRTFLTLSARLAAATAIGSPLQSMAASTGRHPLSFYHTHTGETLTIRVAPEKPTARIKRALNHFLRDFRTGDIHPIDPHLLDQLCRIQTIGGSSGVYEVISGYRSPATNAKLRKLGSGVAKRSLHMAGRAIDVRLTDLDTKTLRDIACSLKQGGVGYYAESDFVHLDTGNPRTW